MIGRIAGIIIHKGLDQALIDVRGVGYIVHVSERTAASLPRVGEAVALFTELVVREDLLQLYGFTSLLEKEWHKLLTSVQGVGAKVSLAILGTLGTDGVARAIALGDGAAVRRAPGVGPKLAQRVVLELKDKAPAIMALGATLGGSPALESDEVIEANTDADAPAPKPRKPRAAPGPDLAAIASAEALSALSNLGYAPSEAASAVAEASANDPSATTPALIRAALRALAPKE
ncbi:Holliday junction branch migration protein RuvA [Paracoccus aminophilus]|uniref:Holliday junction branch migration complex subunit RuvA n=1 Tax=Paracoccus aminophilus JCM 7686 TaxID=1367847 RepID=S5XRB2_PARAH|nr:Holliday junction branch migration protein RuvA [Paracoccus aminophilus]AGT07592.1 Holliday junction DNA helicase RuvA [Paracoccus aminophilus JCM 7686]